MEVQYVVDMAFAVIAFFIGWVLKRIYHSIDELWKKHDEHTRRLTELAPLAHEMPEEQNPDQRDDPNQGDVKHQ